MRLWRITREPYQALDGEGAKRNGGRWNSEGVPVVYLSPALSLAALEYLVHIDIEDVPDDLVALEIEVPDHASRETVRPEDLPADWNQHPSEGLGLSVTRQRLEGFYPDGKSSFDVGPRSGGT